MANISVTYSFTNGTTADASQVNQNFTDIINGTSDGTKDFSISALTVAGTATLNGNINLGNASSDDITVTASLASSIPIKTTFSYDLGSATLGLRDIYLGSADSAARTTKIRGATVASSYTFTLPTTGGTSGYFLTTNGSGTTSWASVGGPEQASNYALAASVAGSALTVALKGADGNDPSTTNAVSIAFRNATATTGTPSIVQATSATSVVVSSGSTLGHGSAVDEYIYVYAINNAGTIELAVTSSRMDEGSILTTTAEGGAGAADSKTTIYSTNARVGVACRLLGRLKSQQATAGTWATAISEISLFPSNRYVEQISEVWVYTANGHGSTNTKIRRWTTTGKSVGSAITYADSAANGGSFTINEYGVYAITYCDDWNASDSHGITLNSAQLTTNLTACTKSTILGGARTAAADIPCPITAIVRLNPGDVIRGHTNGGTTGGSGFAQDFRITKLSD